MIIFYGERENVVRFSVVIVVVAMVDDGVQASRVDNHDGHMLNF